MVRDAFVIILQEYSGRARRFVFNKV